MLERLLQDPKDIQVNPRRWEWSVKRPWPHLEDITACGFWSKPVYTHIRERLLQALPSPTITIGGEYLTVDVFNAEAGAVLHQPSTKLSEKLYVVGDVPDPGVPKLADFGDLT